VVAGIVLFVAVCGGGAQAGKRGLAWEGKPTVRVSPTTGARVLIGRVKNESVRDQFKIRAQDLKLLDQEGQPIRASVVFVSSFVRSIYPQSGRPGARRSDFPEAEQRRIGALAVLRSGESVPLTVSWSELRGPRIAARIDTGHGDLSVPKVAPRG
jgi:hypothetical protein